MGKVAIAGASGGVGRAIAQALEGKHEFVILTRASASAGQEPSLRSRSVDVDYNNIDGLRQILEAHSVHTVICAISLRSEGAGGGQLNLIRAAEKSNVTKRFIPSEFSIPTNDRVAKFLYYHIPKVEATKLLAETSLEWTAIHSGMLLDYLGMPHYPSYLAPVNVWIDMAHDVASIPGSGDIPVVFTHTFDIGEYVAGLLTMPEGTWLRECVVMGDKLTLNDLVKVAEQAKGVPFETARDSEDSLKAGKVTDLPIHKDPAQTKAFGGQEIMQQFLANLGLMVEAGDFNLDEDICINKKLPEIVPRKARDVMACWKGK